MRNDATLLFFVACLLLGKALARAGRLLTAWRSGKMADWGREVAGSIPALNVMLPRLWFVLAWTITLWHQQNSNAEKQLFVDVKPM